MIRHAFKLMWNRKKRSLLLASEILLSFLVLFAVAGWGISGTINYLRPLGFDYENVWVMYVGWRAVENDLSTEEIRTAYEQMQNEMESFDEVRVVSWAMGCIPYGGSSWGTQLRYQGQPYDVRFSNVDDNYASALGMNLTAGRWFSKEDAASHRVPIVVDRLLAEELADGEPILGKILLRGEDDPEELVITGVVDSYRFRGEFNQDDPFYFHRVTLSDSLRWWPQVAIIKVAEGVGVQFEQILLKRVTSVSAGMDVRIEDLADERAVHIKETLIGIGTLAIVAGFLVFNVALGLFGILWYSISRRSSEIGLRRAVGADGRSVALQIILEALVVATFGIVVGIFLTAQVPILGLEMATNHPYQDILAMLVAAGMIYLIVAACALYPSHLAARVQPAQALHDE